MKHQFSQSGRNFTPFRKVHYAKSGEIVNELNYPICSVDIDDVPNPIIEGNAEVIMHCLNTHGDLLSALQDLVGIICSVPGYPKRDVTLEDCDLAKSVIAKSIMVYPERKSFIGPK